MVPPTVNRYKFFDIFQSTLSGYLVPRFDIIINAVKWHKDTPIARGPIFGGLDLYTVSNKDIAGIWELSTKELTIVGFY